MSGVWREYRCQSPQLVANSISVPTEIREEQISPGKRASVYGSLSLTKTENAVETKNM
jgi:hypothetical protein